MREHDALKRDFDAHICQDTGLLAQLLQQVEDKRSKAEVLTGRWREEQTLGKEILAFIFLNRANRVW